MIDYLMNADKKPREKFTSLRHSLLQDWYISVALDWWFNFLSLNVS